MEVVIEFEIKNPKMISVNDQYMHPVRKCKDGRYRSFVCKSPSLKELQNFYQEVLSSKILDEDIEKLQEVVKTSEGSCGLELILNIGIPEKEIYEHDASNFIKAIEDCISSRIKIDDSKNLRVVVEKTIYESEDSSRIIRVTIKPYRLHKFVSLENLNKD